MADAMDGVSIVLTVLSMVSVPFGALRNLLSGKRESLPRLGYLS